MYHLKNATAQLRPDNRTLAATAPLASKTTETQPAAGFTGLEYYNSIFASTVANSVDERLDCFRTRFQVYCIDNPFEDPDDNPDGIETDAFDSHSAHSLLTHRSTGNTIGTVRLVLPMEGGQRRLLPMQRIAGAVASDAQAPFPVKRTGEISRFSIVKSFRQHTPDRGAEAALTPEEWRKMLFHLPLGLIRSCVEMSAREGITHWAAVMEPALLRLLTRLGIHFNPLGPLVNHHGRRQPCWADLDALLSRVFSERPDVWDVITDGGRLWPLTAAHPTTRRAVAV
jgi:N-acyl amino acid synthase of PEP-CTERM/exosortase system